MTNAELKELAQKLYPLIQQQVRTDAKDAAVIRVLNNGTEISTDISGNTVGYISSASVFDTLNMVTAQGYINSASQGRQIDIYTSGVGGTGAPATAQYVTLATDATLTAERVLTAGANITITDGGAGGTVTIAAAAPSAQIHSRSYINFGTNVTGTYTI